jgi:hypothetical protein
MCADKRPNAKAVIENLKVRMPLFRKLWLVMKNSVLKIKKVQNCCGNPGEPGC